MLTKEEQLQKRREAQKRYRETHKEQLKEYSKQYNKKHYWENKEINREKHNEEVKKYYAENREKIIERQKQYYAENRDEILEKQKNNISRKESTKRWRETHKEEISLYNKEHLKTPMGRANGLINSYRHNDIKHNRGECTLTSKWIVENIFGKPCAYCGKEFEWSEIGCDRKDNSLPHTEDNVVPCCLSCNSKKGSMSYEEYIKKVRNES